MPTAHTRRAPFPYSGRRTVVHALSLGRAGESERSIERPAENGIMDDEEEEEEEEGGGSPDRTTRGAAGPKPSPRAIHSHRRHRENLRRRLLERLGPQFRRFSCDVGSGGNT